MNKKIKEEIKQLKKNVNFKDMDQVDEYYYDQLLKIKKTVDNEIKKVLSKYQEVLFTRDDLKVGILHPKENGTSHLMAKYIKRKRLGKKFDKRYMPKKDKE